MAAKILTVFGTRPEAIKMAPLALLLARDPRFESRICVTGQHREMLDQVLDLFRIRADLDLNVMKPGQDLTDLACSRSEEHTSELQSLMRISYAVFCLKKKNEHYNTTHQLTLELNP